MRQHISANVPQFLQVVLILVVAHAFLNRKKGDLREISPFRVLIMFQNPLTQSFYACIASSTFGRSLNGFTLGSGRKHEV